MTISQAANERRRERLRRRKIALWPAASHHCSEPLVAAESDAAIINATNVTGQNWFSLCWRGVGNTWGK